MRHVGMDFDLALFGMKLSDCRSLARCLEYCETLVSLDLSNNFLDDDKIRMLASGLINNLSVVDINLSDNQVADRGVRAFAKLLHANTPLQIINFDNNQVRLYYTSPVPLWLVTSQASNQGRAKCIDWLIAIITAWHPDLSHSDTDSACADPHRGRASACTRAAH